MQERPYWWSPEEHPDQGARRRDWDEEHGRAPSRDDYARRADDDDDDRDWADKATDEVKSWFGNDRAERRRDLDRLHERERRQREEEPYRDVGPQAYHGEDDWLLEQVCSRLADDPYLDASGIMVRVVDNEAILDGYVSSKRAARRAIDIAEDVPGILRVRERLNSQQRRRRWSS